MNEVKAPTVLYIDDDRDDVEILQDVFFLLNPSITLLTAANGVEGLNVLNDLKKSDTLPCLIVMDINMPKLGGRETLLRIKEDTVLAAIPVVIFSTSNSEKDKAYFSDRGIEYITKPISFNQLLQAAKRLLNHCQN